MAWYKPSTWGKKTTTSSSNQSPAPQQSPAPKYTPTIGQSPASPFGASTPTTTSPTTTKPTTTTPTTSSSSSGGGSSRVSYTPSTGFTTTTQTIQQQTASQLTKPQTVSTSVTQVQDRQRTTAQQLASQPRDVSKGLPQERTFLNRIGLARGDEPGVQERGMFIVDPEEAVGFKDSRQSYFSTEGITPDRLASGMGLGLGSVNVTPRVPVFGQTSSGYTRDTQAGEEIRQRFIQEADVVREFRGSPESFKGLPGFSETAEGYSISGDTFNARINYDEIEKNAQEVARQRFAGLTLGTKSKLYGSEIGTGIAKVGVSIPLAGVNIGLAGMTATFKPGETPSLFGDGSRSIKFSSDNALGRIQSANLGWLGKTAQIGTTVALVGAGVKANVAKTGSLKEGLLETASYGGIYKIKSGSFVPSTIGVNKQISSIKLTETGRIFTGKFGDTGVSFKGMEVGGKGFVTTTTPGIRISGGGSRVAFTNTQTTQTYVNIPGRDFTFMGTRGNVGQQLITGTQTFGTEAGKFRFASQDFSRVSYTPSQATFVKEANPFITGFVSGRAKPIYQSDPGIRISGRASEAFGIYAPSGRFQVSQPNVFGRELNLAGVLGRPSKSGSGFTSFQGGGGKTPLSATFQQTAQTFKFIAPPIAPATTIQTPSTVPGLILPTSTVTRQTTRQDTRTFQVPRVNVATSTIQETRPTTTQISRIDTIQVPRSRSSTRQITTPVTPIVTPIERPITTPITTPITIPQTPRTPGRGRADFRTFTPFIPMKLPPFLGIGGMGGLGRIRATRTFRYTPSFGALALQGQTFKLGEVSTKRFTGLEFRASPRRKKKKKGEDDIFQF